MAVDKNDAPHTATDALAFARAAAGGDTLRIENPEVLDAEVPPALYAEVIAGLDRGDALARDAFAGYEIVREIHRGGQGVVYQAIQKHTKRKVAIKVMREGAFANARDRVRFEREVQILGQLKHSGIVAIHDCGESGGHFYFVMDYISGRPLDEYMDLQAAANGSKSGHKEPDAALQPDHDAAARPPGSSSDVQVGLTIDDTLRLFAKICDAVNAAHLRGVIHRDLKPGNIRIDTNGEPHILDFGLARTVMGEGTDGSHPDVMTVTGVFMGSLPWASPEQAEAMPSKIDVRTDVYSLGMIAYHMLTGAFPYAVAGNMRDMLDNIMRAEPMRPSLRPWRVRLGWHGRVARELTDEIDTIILKCLNKDRDRRYQSAGELARDIQHCLAREPIEAKRDSTWYVVRKQVRRQKGRFFALLAICALLVSAASILVTLYINSVRRNVLVEQMNEARLMLKRADESERRGDRESATELRRRVDEILIGRGHDETVLPTDAPGPQEN